MADVISVSYGELVEGWKKTQADLARCNFADDATCAEQHQLADLLRERAAWQQVMKRCPVFVGAHRG